MVLAFYHLKKEEQEILQTIENHQKTLEEAQANKKSSKSLSKIRHLENTILLIIFFRNYKIKYYDYHKQEKST